MTGEFWLNLFFVMLTAVLLENAVFTRAFATDELFFLMKHNKNVLLFGATVTLVTFVGSMITFGVNLLIAEWTLRAYIRPFLFLLTISLLYIALYLILRYKAPKIFEQFKYLLSMACFSCAVMGSLFIITINQYTFIEAIAFGLGVGIGYVGAMLLVFHARRHLALIEVPKPFKGIPILLIYIGLVSLAIYGLIGHQLPA